MTEKLSFIDVLDSVITQVEALTDHPCYDDIPLNAPVPYYHAEIVLQEPVPSKTMWIESYEVFIHCFASGGSSAPVYKLIRKLEEAMTIQLELPAGYQVHRQHPMGLQILLTEEDGTKHAVMGYRLTVIYGYKRKI